MPHRSQGSHPDRGRMPSLKAPCGPRAQIHRHWAFRLKALHPHLHTRSPRGWHCRRHDIQTAEALVHAMTIADALPSPDISPIMGKSSVQGRDAP